MVLVLVLKELLAAVGGYTTRHYLLASVIDVVDVDTLNMLLV